MTPDFTEKPEEESKDPQSLVTAVDTKPEPKEDDDEILVEGGNYIFLVDRSGSMRGTKMETTKAALALFIRSLPEKCNY